MKWSEVDYQLDKFTCSVIFDLPLKKPNLEPTKKNLIGRIYCPYGAMPILANLNNTKFCMVPPYAIVYELKSPIQSDVNWD